MSNNTNPPGTVAVYLLLTPHAGNAWYEYRLVKTEMRDALLAQIRAAHEPTFTIVAEISKEEYESAQNTGGRPS